MDRPAQIKFLQSLSLLILIAGALGSLIMVIYTGRNNSSHFLVILFIGWVLSPFLGCYVARKISSRWSQVKRRSLYLYIIIISLASLFIYTGLLSPSGVKPAFVFLVLPLLSWLLLFAVIRIASLVGRRAAK